jgi:hypothetical protein
MKNSSVPKLSGRDQITATFSRSEKSSFPPLLRIPRLKEWGLWERLEQNRRRKQVDTYDDHRRKRSKRLPYWTVSILVWHWVWVRCNLKGMDAHICAKATWGDSIETDFFGVSILRAATCKEFKGQVEEGRARGRHTRVLNPAPQPQVR